MNNTNNTNPEKMPLSTDNESIDEAQDIVRCIAFGKLRGIVEENLYDATSISNLIQNNQDMELEDIFIKPMGDRLYRLCVSCWVTATSEDTSHLDCDYTQLVIYDNIYDYPTGACVSSISYANTASEKADADRLPKSFSFDDLCYLLNAIATSKLSSLLIEAERNIDSISALGQSSEDIEIDQYESWKYDDGTGALRVS